MALISQTVTAVDVVNVLRRALGYIDPRLIRHGDRVAFLAGEILAGPAGPEIAGVDPGALTLLSVLHDVGAYKTDEIDRMTAFETDDTTAHAVYGFLFCGVPRCWGGLAQAVRYHHCAYSRLGATDCKCPAYAALIYLADRIDILQTLPDEKLFAALRAEAGREFDPRLVERFIRAAAARPLLARLRDGSYEETVRDSIAGLHMTGEEMESTLRMIVAAIDFRSPLTVTHTENTAYISLLLGERLGIRGRAAEELGLGAFLHDIGKISTPVSILEKPGRLTDEEMTVMRDHVAKTEEILEGVVSDRVCRIAARHHEKLNGSGYPRGLTGEVLTLPERIVAVADIMSALLSVRSYKTAFDEEKIRSIMSESAGRGELDGTVVGVLLRDYGEITRQAAVHAAGTQALYDTMTAEFCRISGAGLGYI